MWILSKVKQVIAVHWRDIHFHEAWQEYNIIKQEIPVFVTYGVKLKGGDPLVVAGCVSPTGKKNHRFGDITKIPKGCIVKTEILGEIEIE